MGSVLEFILIQVHVFMHHMVDSYSFHGRFVVIFTLFEQKFNLILREWALTPSYLKEKIIVNRGVGL